MSKTEEDNQQIGQEEVENQLIFNEEEGEEDEAFLKEEEEEIQIIISSSPEDLVETTNELLSYIQVCTSLFIGFEYQQMSSTRFQVQIPNSILPLSVNHNTGLINSPFLIECTFDLSLNDKWKKNPDVLLIKNKVYGADFPGSVLVKNRIRNFFSSDYKPQKKYRCQCYALAPQKVQYPKNSNELIDSLCSEGFSRKLAQKALEFCSFNIEKAREYIIFGVTVSNDLPFAIRYSENPLFYLTLEICEAFFDLTDSCCVCGKHLGINSIKPSCCDNELCQFSFLNMGVGSNIIREIKRDPLASDFIIALAAAACYAPKNPPVFEPAPNIPNVKFTPEFFDNLPSMKNICRYCTTDTQLRNYLGVNNFEILRFFILANKAQLMTIPKEQKVNVNVNGTQFFITSVSPESELIFQQKKKAQRVTWLWHGSLTDRWYRILHTGLKDFGQTEYTTHGPPYFGKGIYMSESFNYSYWYCTAAPNKYKNSALPKNLLIISLVENANTPGLTRPVTNHEYTQTDDKACITRVLFVMDPADKKNKRLDTNTLIDPPIVPTYQDVLLPKIKQFYSLNIK